MSLVKRIKGDLEFRSIEPTNEMLFKTKTLTIDGDLVVTGTKTSVESTDTNISDNKITLNSGEQGHGITISPHTSGIEIDRGTATNVNLVYKESSNRWEATDNGVDWYPLQPLTTGFELLTDTTPQLGGDLDVNGFKITSANDGDIVLESDGVGLLKINTTLSIKEQLNDEFFTVGYNKIYAKVPGSGGSGIFFKNTVSGDELVSRTKAIVFSLIF